MRVTPAFVQVEGSDSFVNMIDVVRVSFPDGTAVLTLATPDANGNREVVFRDPKRIKEFREYLALPPIEP